MLCPKCGFDSELQSSECLKCGIIFEKYLRHKAAVESAGPTLQADVAVAETSDPQQDRRELILRFIAVPAALIFGRIAMSVAPFMIRLLSMWVHEFGHAATAWLCGFGALPGPWITSIDSDRSWTVTVLVTGAIGFAAFRFWQARRWLAIAGCGAVLALQVVCRRLFSDQAQQLIIFGGDAGCFVFGSVLIATFYARRESPLYQNALRWGMLIIGSLSFMDAYYTWSGGIERIPFGENENGTSDPSVLTDLYGWPLKLLRDRYDRLAILCLFALAIVYVIGLVGPAGALAATQPSKKSD